MKSRPSMIRSSGVSFAVVMILCLCYSAFADGTGRIVTPYSIHDPVTVALVTKTRNKARHKAVASFYKKGTPTPTRAPLREASFAYSKPGQSKPKPVYTIDCLKATGGKITLDLANVESFTIEMQDVPHHRTRITAVIFPDLSPSKLVNLQPTYTTLHNKYRTSIELWVKTTDSKNRSLALMGAEEAVSLESLAAETEVRFLVSPSTDVLWWSIPSVTDDPAYPYKLVTAD